MKNALLAILATMLITVNGCKQLGPQGTYSLKGKIVKDCGGMPLTIYGVRLYRGPGFEKPGKTLATAETDLDGNFIISGIPVYEKSDLYIYHDVDANTITDWLNGYYYPPANGSAFPADGQVVDLGTFYGSYQVNTVAKISINLSQFNINDTIYVGRDKYSFYAIFPIQNSKTVSFTNEHGVPSLGCACPDSFALYWSNGKQQYDSLVSPSKPNNFQQHIFYSKSAICSYPDTTYYSIP